MSAPGRSRVPRALRLAAYGLLGSLWLTGVVWWWLQLFGRHASQFGPTPHPLQPALLLAHGVLAVPALYLLGWITPGHVWDGWRSRQRRASGGALWLALLVLGATGFALFFLVADAPRAATSLAHEALGLASVTVAAVHWLRRRPGV